MKFDELPHEPSMEERVQDSIASLHTAPTEALLEMRREAATSQTGFSSDFNAELVRFIDFILNKRDEDVRAQLFREHRSSRDA